MQSITQCTNKIYSTNNASTSRHIQELLFEYIIEDVGYLIIYQYAKCFDEMISPLRISQQQRHLLSKHTEFKYAFYNIIIKTLQMGILLNIQQYVQTKVIFSLHQIHVRYRCTLIYFQCHLRAGIICLGSIFVAAKCCRSHT